MGLDMAWATHMADGDPEAVVAGDDGDDGHVDEVDAVAHPGEGHPGGPGEDAVDGPAAALGSSHNIPTLTLTQARMTQERAKDQASLCSPP